MMSYSTMVDETGINLYQPVFFLYPGPGLGARPARWQICCRETLNNTSHASHNGFITGFPHTSPKEGQLSTRLLHSDGF